MKKLSFLLAFAALLLIAETGSTAQQNSYQVIVHADNQLDSISKTRVSQLLLKKVPRWEEGTPAAPVDLDSKSPVRAALSKDVHGRSVSSIKSYWQRQIFSGREVPPPEFSEAQVLQYVQSHPGSIGYVAAGTTLPSNVKALAVVN